MIGSAIVVQWQLFGPLPHDGKVLFRLLPVLLSNDNPRMYNLAPPSPVASMVPFCRLWGEGVLKEDDDGACFFFYVSCPSSSPFSGRETLFFTFLIVIVWFLVVVVVLVVVLMFFWREWFWFWFSCLFCFMGGWWLLGLFVVVIVVIVAITGILPIHCRQVMSISSSGFIPRVVLFVASALGCLFHLHEIVVGVRKGWQWQAHHFHVSRLFLSPFFFQS